MAVGALVGFSEVTIFNVVISVFVVPITQDTGWSRGTISGAVTLGGLGGGLLALTLGPVFDRFGPRYLVASGGAIAGLSLLAVSQAQEVWQFYVFYVASRVVGVAAISAGINIGVSNWFVARRSRAMGISHLGQRMGGILLPPLLQAWVATHGWRNAWGFNAWLVLALCTIPTALFLRRRPEDHGLLPDGRSPGEALPGGPGQAAPAATGAGAVEGWSPRDALRSRAFWHVTLAMAAAYLVFGGTNLHFMAYLLDRGIDSGTAVAAVSLFSASSGVAGVLAGLAADRFTVRWVMTAVLALGSLSSLALTQVASGPAALAYALLGGAVFGGILILSSTVYAEYFGRRSLGAIAGLAQPVTLVGNATGPGFAGAAYDLTGGYLFVFATFAVLYALGALSLALAPAATPASARRDANTD